MNEATAMVATNADAPCSPHQERKLAKSLMETPDGRPSALAHQLSAPKGAEGEAVIAMGPQQGGPAKGAAGRLMTAAERKRLEEAIDKSESLEGEWMCARGGSGMTMLTPRPHTRRDPTTRGAIEIRVCY